MTKLTIEYLGVTELSAWKRRARKHSKKQIRQLKKVVQECGFNVPILVDGDMNILGGHARLEAAKLLGMTQVPCVRLEHMSESQKRAFRLADNKIALEAGWDEEALAEELAALCDLDPDFDIELTGFTIAEIDGLIEGIGLEDTGNPVEDQIPELNIERRCEPGDIWQVGQHRLICADARDAEAVTLLMDGSMAQMVFTDPPYNVPIDGNVGGLGRIHHREFQCGAGEMSPAQFIEFLRCAFEQLVKHSCDGAIHFICMDWRHMEEIRAAGAGIYSELKNLIVWAKDNGGMGTFYRSRHELIFAFKVGLAEHINSFELGQHGRYRTNVWEYKGVNSMKAGRLEELALHPTVKPVQMIADAIKDVSQRGAIVLDLFGGSGSTLIAAQKTGRRAYLCELDPIYCDRILHRWETYAKDEAVKLVCGWTGADLSTAHTSHRSTPEAVG